MVRRNDAVSASISMTVDEIGAHDQDVLLELRQQDQHPNHDQRQRRPRQPGGAATRARGSSKAPSEQGRQPRDEVILGVQQDGRGCQMQQHEHANAQTMAKTGQEGQSG